MHFHSMVRAGGILLGMLLVLAACGSPGAVSGTPQLLDVYASPAAGPWLSELYACAPAGTVLRVVIDPAGAQLTLRLGEPDVFSGPAYQVGLEDVLVVTHRQSQAQNLTAAEVRELFAGTGDPSLQVWVYAGREDVQQLFDRAVMAGRPVTSQARLATSPQHMSDTLVNTPGAVGILPRRWKAGDSRVVYTLPDIPVLALVKETPQGAIQAIIACLQK